jgi:uncharacterized membrane protein
LISTHVPTDEKDEVEKEKFYNSLGKVCHAVPNYDMKKVLGDFNATLEKGPIYIQHVEGTAFTAKRTLMESEW